MTEAGPSPRRRKLRMLRPGAVPEDLVLVIRAAQASRSETVGDLVKDAQVSAETYAIDQAGVVELLYGVSVFVRRPGPGDALKRFLEAPAYLEVPVGRVRTAGFAVLPTGANPDHFDVQLVSAKTASEPATDAEVAEAADRLARIAGDLLPNPFYSGRRR